MSDLFHEDVPAAFIERVFSVMGRAERHMFQVLTKRPERMLQWFSSRRFDCKGAAILQTENIGECHYALPWPLPNVWLGVSCENQATADERIPLLVQTPSAVRFLSCEPLLAAINLDGLWGYPGAADSAQLASWPIQWVIAGGESGPAARPCALEWIAAIVEQCRTAGVACFVKQLGAYVVSEHRTAPDDCFAGTPPHRAPNGEGWAWRMGLANRKGGDPAEWPEDLRVREFPAVTQP
jgi:protein gp37